MSHNWIINVADRIYGPYTVAQMQAFAAEGRLGSSSLVARGGCDQFVPASCDPDLRTLFASHPAHVSAKPEVSPLPVSQRRGLSRQERSEPSHFVVVADITLGSISKLQDEIFCLGPAHAVAPQVWILSTNQSVGAVRNHLLQKLGKTDRLLVIDATHDKMAWSNYAPEDEIRVKRVWMKQASTAFA